MRLNVWGLVAALLGGVVGNVGVLGCSCIAPPPPDIAAQEVDLVFAGTVIAKSVSNEAEPFSHFEVAFEVDEAFKGANGAEQLVVNTGRDSAICGVFFEVGSSYLVYAREANGEFSTNLCDRTTSMANASDDLVALRVLFPENTDPVARLGIERTNLTVSIEDGAGQAFHLEATTDFQRWARRETFQPDGAEFTAEVPLEPAAAQEFFRVREAEEEQGIFGITFFLPGVCLEDPENPGECVNLPYPGEWSYELRALSDTPDLGRENPVITSFTSSGDATELLIPVALAEGLDESNPSEGLIDALLDAGWLVHREVEVQLRRVGRAWLLIEPQAQSVVYLETQGESIRAVRTGTFRVPLAAGNYCVWSFFGCEAQVDLAAGEWRFLSLSVPLP